VVALDSPPGGGPKIHGVPDSGLLLIGAFSRASCLSVRSLRAYHEAGLLVPAVVDPRTGYRSYSIAQLTDAAVIRRLRALDVPLEAIGQILEARDPDTTRKVLREHGAVLEERLAATQRAVDDLYTALDLPASHTPVHVRHEPARSALTLSETVPDAEPFLRRAAGVLQDALRVSGAVATGGFGALFPAQIEDDEAEDIVAFVPVDAAPRLGEASLAASVRIGELPATDVAVVVHHGSFESMVDTYRNLGAWVAANAATADLAVREYYLDEVNTEICWPVH
jgi:DNA-binding transcriptional MerR regulator